MPDKSASEKSGERIAKVMARAGLCSRRAAEQWIAAGRVAVNGETIASPARNVGPRDRIAIDGKPLPARDRTRLFLYHKSRGLVTTSADPERRPTIFGALPKHLPRLVTVGRLDLNTEGLLLLTNDGGLARILELPETGWLRRYRVRAHGSITQDALAGLRNGITIDGIRYGPIEATLDRAQGANVWLTFAMREGKNREIRNVLGHLGLKVNRLIRVSYGPFQLGELPDGATEEVKTRVLREQLGERIVQAAGADFSAPIVAYDTEDSPQARIDVRHLPPKAIVTKRPRQEGKQREPDGVRRAHAGKPIPARRESRGEAPFDARVRRPRPAKSEPGTRDNDRTSGRGARGASGAKRQMPRDRGGGRKR